MQITKLSFLLILGLALTSSCEKELPKFEDVATQNTYIQNSYITLENSHWTWDNDDDYYYKDIPLPSITQNVLDEGTVICNLLLDDDRFAQLPFTMYLSGSNYKYMGCIVSLNNIRLMVTNKNNAQNPQPGSVDFKVVVVDVYEDE